MKRLVLIAALAGLSACGQKAEEGPAPAATDTTAPAQAAGSTAVDGKPDTGVFELTSADGKEVVKQTYNADGTLSSTTDGKTVTGTWSKKEPSTYCVTLEGDVAATCYLDKMDGGVWSTTNEADPKDTFTIKRVG